MMTGVLIVLLCLTGLLCFGSFLLKLLIFAYNLCGSFFPLREIGVYKCKRVCVFFAFRFLIKIMLPAFLFLTRNAT